MAPLILHVKSNFSFRITGLQRLKCCEGTDTQVTAGRLLGSVSDSVSKNSVSRCCIAFTPCARANRVCNHSPQINVLSIVKSSFPNNNADNSGGERAEWCGYVALCVREMERSCSYCV
jgi:hypothetical protein